MSATVLMLMYSYVCIMSEGCVYVWHTFPSHSVLLRQRNEGGRHFSMPCLNWTLLLLGTVIQPCCTMAMMLIMVMKVMRHIATGVWCRRSKVKSNDLPWLLLLPKYTQVCSGLTADSSTEILLLFFFFLLSIFSFNLYSYNIVFKQERHNDKKKKIIKLLLLTLDICVSFFSFHCFSSPAEPQ